MIARLSDVDRMFDAMGLLRGRFDNIFDEFDRSISYRSEVVPVSVSSPEQISMIKEIRSS